MSILNYFFIGTGFTFLMDLLLGIEGIKNHPKMKATPPWDIKLRIFCIIVWPLSALVFVIAFLKQYFK
jgi:hypothetical protein